MANLGSLPSNGESFANAVSGDGSVVVGHTGAFGQAGQAFRSTSGDGMVGLGDLPGGALFSNATGVSADGTVVVGFGHSASGTEAFRWSVGTGMVGLGDFPGGTFFSQASGVSADGSVVVGDGSSGSGTQAFRWTSTGGMVGLGDLAGGGFLSAAFAISADGSVVVGRSESASGGEAFRWTSEGGMVGLGDLPGGSFNSFAWGVSFDGSVVVGQGDTNGNPLTPEAFVWTAGAGMRNLREVLIEHGIDMTGWTLYAARGVADDGLGLDTSITIVGDGRNPNGELEAWLARIPEPSTALLLAGGITLLALQRRRSAEN
jgi:probable HAF family extracellular repeat protein